MVDELCGDLAHIRAPRGAELHARARATEAPLRMLLNNLDPDVAEHPEKLVVYGGAGAGTPDPGSSSSTAGPGRPLGTRMPCAPSSALCSSCAKTRRCSCRVASPSGCSARTQ